MNNKTFDSKNIQRCFVGTLAIFIITYYAVVRGGELRLFSDYVYHTDSALLISRNIDTLKELLATRKIPYPLWHIVVKLFYRFWGGADYEAAAVTTALFNCITYWSVNYVWINYKKDPNKTVENINIWLWSIFLMVMGPVYVPSITYHYYGGQGTGNVLHNPTNIAVKGFAVLSFAFICYILNTEICKKKHYIILAVLLAVSALAKPVFLQGIIPGLGIYFIIQVILEGKTARKNNIVKFIKIAACFIPSAIILCIQFGILFFSNQGSQGIGFGWGVVLKNSTPSIATSFLLAFAFPISVLIIDFKNIIKCKEYQLALCYELCAWLEGMILYENNSRMFHGNWVWGSFISMFMLWMVSLIKLWEYIGSDNNTIKKNISIIFALSMFLLQVLCGIRYYWMAIVLNMGFNI